ncbi:hypothetical protein HanIR_Chr16g0802541 [Helianthus annuus]|nr:hypothetical protein HanIR_Chr16g0802541 [Helianthus annuus]
MVILLFLILLINSCVFIVCVATIFGRLILYTCLCHVINGEIKIHIYTPPREWMDVVFFSMNILDVGMKRMTGCSTFFHVTLLGGFISCSSSKNSTYLSLNFSDNPTTVGGWFILVKPRFTILLVYIFYRVIFIKISK